MSDNLQSEILKFYYNIFFLICSVRYFPFDTQWCNFKFAPVEDRRQVNFTISERRQSAITSSEWNLLKSKATNHDHISGDDLYQIGAFHILLQRDPQYYFQTIVAPSSLLCVLSLTAFLASPESGERISFSVSVILGLSVFQLLVSEKLPAASKNPPILSGYLSQTFLLSCLTVPFSLLSMNLSFGNVRATVLKYRTCRILLLQFLPKVLFIASYIERILQSNDFLKKLDKKCKDSETVASGKGSLSKESSSEISKGEEKLIYFEQVRISLYKMNLL